MYDVEDASEKLRFVLADLATGFLQEGVIVRQGKEHRNNSKSKLRILPIEAALNVVSDVIEEVVPSQDTKTPYHSLGSIPRDMYNSSVKTLDGLDTVLNRAESLAYTLWGPKFREAVRAGRTGQISGERIDNRSPKNKKVKSRPYQDGLIQIRRRILEAKDHLTHRYRMWAKANDDAKFQIKTYIEEGDKSAETVDVLYMKLSMSYGGLSRGLEHFADEWLRKSAEILGTEQNIEAVLRSLRATESNARSAVRIALDKSTIAGKNLGVEQDRFNEGYGVLTGEDIGQRSENGTVFSP